MRTTRKVLLALVLTLCVAAVLAVAAFAAMPTGQTKEEATDWEQNYADVASGDGWILLTTSDAIDPLCRVQPGEEAPVLVKTPGGKVYYNKTLKKVVIIASGTLAGDHGDGSSVPSSSFTKSIPVAYFIEDMWAVIEQHFASNDVAWTKRIGGTGYPTTIGGTGTTGATWTWVYVIKSDYELMKVEFDRINADTTLTDDQKKIEKVKVAVNYAPRYQNKNVSEEGAMWTLGYLFKLMSADQTNYPFETLEFRVAKKGSLVLQNFSFITEHADSVKTIVLDSRIVMVSPQAEKDGSRGVFRNLAKLVSLGHVVYEDYSGEYKTDVAGATFVEGKVNVSGFTALGTAGHYGIFRDSPSITDVIWYTSFKYGSTEMAGKIDIRAFTNCTGLKTVTLTAPLTEIASNAFYKCTSLETIDLRGGIADGATIATDAFASTTQNINVYVYSMEDASRATALFQSFTKIKIVKMVSPAEEALIADGFSIRINDTNAKKEGPALRAEFTLSAESVLAAKNETGLGLLDYGIVVFSENTLKNVYDNDIDAIVAAIKAETINPDKVKVVSAANGPYVSVNKETGDKTFAAAITGISAENYDSAVYTYAYAAWSDGSITYTTYTSSREATAGQSAFSLYDATIFAYRNGIVNSQNFVMSTGVELWDILSKGAFSVYKDEVKAPVEGLTPVKKYENDYKDGYFTYYDLPLRSWVYYKDKWGNQAWDAGGHHVEEIASTNVLWSLLKDGDELVVVYRRDPNAADGAVSFLPQLVDRTPYAAYAPFSPLYFSPGTTASWHTYHGIVDSELINGTSSTNGLYKNATLYSPILSDDNASLITALVIDHGITSFKKGALENSSVPNLATIVYPEGVSTTGTVIGYNSSVSEVIYASDTKTSLSKATEGIGKIADLSGLKAMTFGSAFASCKKIENVILPETLTLGSVDNQYLFSSCSSLKRVWMHGSEVPAEGTLDLTRTGLKTVCKDAFHGLPTNTKILMPESFVGVASYSYQIKEAEACSRTFGADKEYTFVLQNANGLTNNATGAYGMVVFYKAIMDSSIASGHKDNLDHITIKLGDVSKSLAEWKAYYDALATE